MNAQPVISVRRLSKVYGDVRAVDGIDLQVNRGEVYGFLGRNGAGKTTTIRMMLGLVRPTSGEISVFGTRIRPGSQAVLARVGTLVETATAYPNLTVHENLEIQRRLQRSPREAVDEVISLLGLDREARRRAGHLSLGNRQRLALARALLHRPDLLMLDEPVNGLDPAGIVEIRKLLRRLADERGVTIFLSSHILSEIAQLADRIGIIHHGRIIEDLDREELKRRSRGYLEVDVSDTARAAALLNEHLGIEKTEQADGRLRLYDAMDRAPEIVRLFVMHDLDVMRICAGGEDLEDHFMRLTGDTQ